MKKATTLSMLVALGLCTTSVFAATTNSPATLNNNTNTVVANNKNESALSGFYITARAGASMQRLGSQKSEKHNFGSKFKTSFTGGAAVGYNFNSEFNLPIRVELAYMATANAKTHKADGNAINNMKVGLQTVMVNGYYDIYNSSAFTPYIGLGVGYAHAKFNQNNTVANSADALSKANNKFAFDATVGVNYAITNNLSADLSYTYTQIGKIKAQHNNSQASTNLSTHNVLVGVRYAF